jgi:hypothetical protein
VTISKPAFAYLGYLAKMTTMGGSANAVAAFLLTREIERLRLSGDYAKEIPSSDVESTEEGAG